jgi:NADH:ubiquinone oxidoreductase subunit E
LFTDTSNVGLKSVLLNNGIKLPSVSLAHAARMKESNENMVPLLEKIQREKYIWNICGDLKFIAALLGL